jgi:hypothetical protein
MIINRPLYTPSSKAAIRLYTNLVDTSRIWINGLNSITPPSLDRGTFEVTEFGKVALTVAGLPSFGSMQGAGNAIYGDAGQHELASRLVLQTEFTDMHVYLLRDDNNPEAEIIMIPDLANDPESHFQVKNTSPGAGNVNSVYPVTLEFTAEGLMVFTTVHYADPGSPDITFTAGTPDTITDATSGFVDAGFEAGMTIYVEGFGSPNFGKMGVIDTVAAGTLTMEEDNNLVTDAVGDTGTILRGGFFGL